MTAAGRMRTKRRRRAGFTLVETMTALAIFALLSGLLTSALFAARQSGAATIAKTDEALAAMRLGMIFSSTLQALATSQAPRGDQPAHLFRGDAASIQFAAALDGQTDRSGLFAVTMRIEPDPARATGERLVFERRRLHRDETAPARTETAILHTSSGSLSFSFVDEREEGAAGTGFVRALKPVSLWADAGRVPRRVLLLENDRIIAEARLAIEIDSRCIVAEGMERFDRAECRLQ